jgi:hypothetical protein
MEDKKSSLTFSRTGCKERGVGAFVLQKRQKKSLTVLGGLFTPAALDTFF